VGQLPDEATDIEFDEDIDGQTGYRTAERSHTFEGAHRETAFAAARAALVHQNYNVIVIDITNGAVIGKRAASTLFAGIYVSDSEADAQARIIVKTTVVFDPTLFGIPVPMHPVDDEAKKLLEAMELFIAAEISITPDENTN
jgi:hypothetical protein